jgi:hypothetical protein
MVHEVTRVALAAKDTEVKHANAFEVRIVFAAVVAAAADAVVAAHHLPKLGANLVTARPVEEIVNTVAS